MDSVDNCFNVPNGPTLGVCARDISGKMVPYRDGESLVTCENVSQCADPVEDVCQMGQEDSNDNAVGDACEGYADFNCSRGVGPDDLIALVESNCYYKDTIVWPACQKYDINGDFIVSAWDHIILKLQYGRDDLPISPSCL